MPGNGRAKRSPSAVFDAESFLTTAGAGRSISNYKATATIFRQGAECDTVFYILKGFVDLTMVSEQGKVRVVAQLGPASFIGEGCLTGLPRYLASARALTEATVARIEAKTMARALDEHPELSKRFMTYLLQRNGQVEADLVDHLFNSSEKRLARLLLMLAQIGAEGQMRTVSSPISQEILAARVGTTRPRVNFFLNKFRKLGLIEYNGELKVHSSLLNVILGE